jgi:hypothetical protein
VDAIVVTGPNKFVPQRLYRPFTEADKERYLERVSLSAPIIFVTKEPFEWGISLEDVRNGKTRHLVDKEVAVLQDCGPSVSIRINVSEQPLERNVAANDHYDCSPVAWICFIQTSNLFAKLAQDEGSNHEGKARTKLSEDYLSIHRGGLISQGYANRCSRF